MLVLHMDQKAGGGVKCLSPVWDWMASSLWKRYQRHKLYFLDE